MIKITPDTYQQMNDEFIEEGTPFTITIPTQQQIDECLERSDHWFPKVVHKPLIVIPQQGVLSEKEIELHFGSMYEKEIDELIEEDEL